MRILVRVFVANGVFFFPPPPFVVSFSIIVNKKKIDEDLSKRPSFFLKKKKKKKGRAFGNHNNCVRIEVEEETETETDTENKQSGQDKEKLAYPHMTAKNLLHAPLQPDAVPTASGSGNNVNVRWQSDLSSRDSNTSNGNDSYEAMSMRPSAKAFLSIEIKPEHHIPEKAALHREGDAFIETRALNHITRNVVEQSISNMYRRHSVREASEPFQYFPKLLDRYLNGGFNKTASKRKKLQKSRNNNTDKKTHSFTHKKNKLIKKKKQKIKRKKKKNNNNNNDMKKNMVTKIWDQNQIRMWTTTKINCKRSSSSNDKAI
ncbi:hypothetical protein RFI_14823 [Reticulomyxa filosa]|uniref:Uncharacterized protein n=1 Tax=Reticulomyxa filosa TaxID=46433 RepID=X6N8N8_RETFI|nr:hypothetical protein RFI_14823 [Reticulomyxa filosa]|eukprot:ETO22376.1 hypothetical protein RFI_14823 [Reticulomyxa filosa]